jgi:hypothetical protein
VNDGNSAFASLPIPRTDSRNGATLATWNLLLGQLEGNQIVGKTVTVEVKDDIRFFPDKLLGTCSHVVTPAEVTAGVIDIKPPDCNDEVQDARFELKPAP